MKNEVNLNTLHLTYPLPALLRRSYSRLAVSKLSPDYSKDSDFRREQQRNSAVESNDPPGCRM
jgi:hypothetical protein